jgi:RNA polymerase sigma factor (TIGR02999 family)
MQEGPDNPAEAPSPGTDIVAEGPSADEFLACAYNELRNLARQKMAGESPGLTLQPTALLHEAYLRLVSGGPARFDNEAHFFASVAEAMRRILVERARRRARLKHGGGRERVTLDEATPSCSGSPGVDLVAMDAVIDKLQRQDPRMADIVKLRFYGGLTSDEAAAALGLAPRTVYRAWNAARAWLRAELERHQHGI